MCSDGAIMLFNFHKHSITDKAGSTFQTVCKIPCVPNFCLQ